MQVGPLVDAKSRDKVVELVGDAVGRGATVRVGGDAARRARLLLPAHRAHRRPARRAADQEEIFGPVAPISVFDTDDEAVAAANDTEFGLVSYLYTENLARALRVSEALESGMVGLNTGLVSNPAAPFGGIKQSGLGREGGPSGSRSTSRPSTSPSAWAERSRLLRTPRRAALTGLRPCRGPALRRAGLLARPRLLVAGAGSGATGWLARPGSPAPSRGRGAGSPGPGGRGRHGRAHRVAGAPGRRRGGGGRGGRRGGGRGSAVAGAATVRRGRRRRRRRRPLGVVRGFAASSSACACAGCTPGRPAARRRSAVTCSPTSARPARTRR